MSLLIHLLWRIGLGERLEPGSKKNTSVWLGILATLPVSMTIFVALPNWIEKTCGFSLLDSYSGIVALIVGFALVTLGMMAVLARAFRRAPFCLLPIAVAFWIAGAWLAWNQIAA